MMWAIVPLALQGALMSVDEAWFHRRRGLPRWERIGHPLDTLSVALAQGWLLFHHDRHALVVYAVLASISCLLVTKDEAVHARECTPGEHFIHALLFVLHPIVFFTFAWMWMSGEHLFVLWLQLAATISFAAYQIVYWSALWERTMPSTPSSARDGTKRTTIPSRSSVPNLACETPGSQRT